MRYYRCSRHNDRTVLLPTNRSLISWRNNFRSLRTLLGRWMIAFAGKLAWLTAIMTYDLGVGASRPFVRWTSCSGRRRGPGASRFGRNFLGESRPIYRFVGRAFAAGPVSIWGIASRVRRHDTCVDKHRRLAIIKPWGFSLERLICQMGFEFREVLTKCISRADSDK